MDKTQLFKFLTLNRLGVLSTLGPMGEPQSALVGFAVTSEFEIIFDTVSNSRKFRNLARDRMRNLIRLRKLTRSEERQLAVKVAMAIARLKEHLAEHRCQRL